MLKRKEEERRRLIAALCDRKPVDWAERRARHPELAPLLDSLEALQGIATASREVLAELGREDGASAHPVSGTESTKSRSASRPGRKSSPPGRAPADPAASEAMFTWGSLKVLARLGAGGFGEVFQAFDPTLERQVALKLFRPKPTFEPEEFLAEARRLARVRHPNVLSVHGADFHDGRLGMWTDLVEGRTLEQWIAADGPLSPREAAGVGIELCRALAAVHAAGLLHRDLKTRNVMRETGGRIVLMDFGAMTERGPDPERNLGTPATMAPEQLLGGRLSPATDIFGLGCVLYRIVTGADPIEPGSVAELRARHRRGAITPLRDRRAELPTGFIEIVERSLAGRASGRYASAGAMERALTAWLRAESKQVRARRAAPAAALVRKPAVRLPSPLTTFVGREREAAAAGSLLEQARLVTLTGPGGCGKTRLAIHVAEHLGEAGARETRFVDLASVGEPERLAWAVASALEVREERNRDLVETLSGHLAQREFLIVLDNCEHLRAACARLAEHLLARCPQLRILATSRERLGVAGERVYNVPPLSLPEPEKLESPEIAHSEAVRLFLERAAAAAPDFRPAGRDLATAARIVLSLDGLPLAIELAAARMRVLSAGEILDRLEDRFRLLTGDRDAGPARHSTLRATIQWSYDLLEAREQRLLRSLSVFVGGWTLEAARAVAGLDEFEILDGLERLVDKSLVSVGRPEGDATRYFLLETVRRFALETLEGSGEREAAREGHRDHFLAMAEAAAAELTGPGLKPWLARLDGDHENLLAALYACDVLPDGAQRGLRLAGALSVFWQRRGHFRIGEAALEHSLARPGAELKTTARGVALHGAVRLALELRGARLPAGDVAKLEEGLSLFRSLKDPRGIAAALNQKGFVALECGDHAGAAAAFEEGLALARESGSHWHLSALLNNLGELERTRGNVEAARAHYLEALALKREARDPVRIAVLLANVVVLDVQRGALGPARENLAESLRHLAEVEAPIAACTAIHAAAAVAGAAGEHEHAARWFGAADAQWQAIGSAAESVDAETFAPILARVREALGADAFEAALGAGAGLALEAVIRETTEWAKAGHDADSAHP